MARSDLVRDIEVADDATSAALELRYDGDGRLNVRILGAVLNEVSTSAAEDSYYLQYYFAYEPDTPRETGKPAVAVVRDRPER